MSADERGRPPEPSGPPRSYHLDPDGLRERGAQVLEWIARYQERVEDLPVRSPLAPGEVRAALPTHPPERPEPFAEVLADLDRVVLPGITHWQSPSWFAYFPANTSGPSILGDLVSSGLGVQGMLWSTSPACTELELHVLDWMVELLALPEHFRSDGPGGGVIQGSASEATLCAVLAARVRAGTVGGGDLEVLRAYGSEHAHSSLEKAVRIAGLRADQLRPIESDDRFGLRPDRLRAAVEADLAAGLRPFFVMATAGTTSSLAFDPVPEVAEVCEQHDLWLHVDAAMAGSAAVCPDLRWVNAGVERADSYAFNPHKWLFTGFDCDCFWVADRQPLLAALSILPEYLRNEATDAGSVVDLRDWQIPLGRRFRSLKLWFVLRHYGAEGLRHHVSEHVRLAAGLAERVEAHPRLELVAPASLNLVCFAHVDGDEASEVLLRAVNETGEAFLTHTRLGGRYVVRCSIGQTHTEARHVDALWALVERFA